MTDPERKPKDRRLLAVEVVQSSSMDCGPAALKCLLEGYHVPISFGRLREACQTDVDGTSIDTIEEIAQDLGLIAEQALIPIDHVTLASADALPAIVIVGRAGALHFVVAWRRHGRWLELMDPAVGRRWVSLRQFRAEIYVHSASVDLEDWIGWAVTDAFLNPLRERLRLIGVGAAAAEELVAEALAGSHWHPIATLDAAVRLAQSLIDTKGIRSGSEAERVLRSLIGDARESFEGGRPSLIPKAFWAVTAGDPSTASSGETLNVKGAILLGVSGIRTQDEQAAERRKPLSLELEAALAEKPVSPLASLWRMLGEDGLLAPLALVLAGAFAVSAAMIEVLLFRGVFDISAQLALPSQRLFAAIGLLVFAAILLAIEYATGLGTLRWGRKLEARLRMALLAKIPRLNDRYFHSRPISDMADRNHNIQAVRAVPGLALRLIQSVLELAITFVGVLIIAPASWPLAALLTLATLSIPFTIQHLLNERDLRVRNHAGALNSFYLDGMLGLAPVRAHRAERSVQGQHESLLVEWAKSMRGLINLGLAITTLQAIVATGLVGALLLSHFLAAGRVTGSDLLLVFWALKIPALGAQIARIAHQYPAQRNVLSRLLEPLAAPEDLELAPEERQAAAARTALMPKAAGVALEFHDGSVIAAGNSILQSVDFSIAAGEHVAIVGTSGAGKSSLLGVLLGWHRLASGQLLIDGEQAHARDITALRQHTAWVDPAIQIWNRSLLDNLTYASDDESTLNVGEVIAAARLRGVTQKLPQGLQTLLGEGGGLLSGGEGQRVRLARALLSPSTRLALLDEPFRGMDRTQRRALLAEARKWWASVTLLCVTHDVGETMSFDRVLVVEDGRIIEDGSPRSLAARESRYRELLDAEAALGETMWQGDFWRRLTLADGRLKAGEIA
jgi:ATP-binding cassette subfamily B protein